MADVRYDKATGHVKLSVGRNFFMFLPSVARAVGRAMIEVADEATKKPEKVAPENTQGGLDV